MNDLNCPNCGTSYQSLNSGYCDCCGYEFTNDYIIKAVSAEKEKEKNAQQKIAEENRQRQMLLKKEEKERKAKAKAAEKARIEAEKASRKEREEREKIALLIEKNKNEYERDLRFSLLFKKFRKVSAAFGFFLVIISVIGTVIFFNELGVDFIVPKKVVESKIEAIKEDHFISVKLDEEQNMLIESSDIDNGIKLPECAVKLFNSVSSLNDNQRTTEEKLTHMFPKCTAFLNKFVENSKESEIKPDSVEASTEKHEQGN